ncbi:hypothetical protein ACQKGO_09565 [Corallococcus interemptor]|uniref:hypothetical protein n=1 Tax=Corallococcus interemptor TaxID=2316720 RepID=UPI003CFE3797
MLATLVRQGRVREDAVSAATVRRLLDKRGLGRVSLRGTRDWSVDAGRPRPPARCGTATAAMARCSPAARSRRHCASTRCSTMGAATSSTPTEGT